MSNGLFNGPPGSGKSMLAARLPSILPPMTPRELLDVSMIHSVAGARAGGALTDRRPFRSPHHSASMPALVGGGCRFQEFPRLSSLIPDRRSLADSHPQGTRMSAAAL